MSNAKKKDEDEDEKNRKIFKRSLRRKRDIIVCGNCTSTFVPNFTLNPFNPRIQTNR
jgi:predicted Holliday junction resolvase-like endonuclease